MLRYFKWSIIVTVVGLGLGAWLGWALTGTVEGVVGTFVIVAILAVLEISLSFDNAIVNANKLKQMQPVWQRRFLTWGILIAVFGMRVIFPLAIVSLAAWIGPVEAVRLAIAEPSEYARIMHEAHTSIAAFGGTFLLMVSLNYFFDEHKDIHWLAMLEKRFSRVAAIRGIEISIALLLIVVFSLLQPAADQLSFIRPAIYGLLTFLAMEVLGHALDRSQEAQAAGVQGGLGAFLYLEVLDASFSFDGVVGAFALSQNLFIIAIGLGIGAMFVRSMTIMLVENRTLGQYRYLEHGAFYAVMILSVLMYAQTLMHIPEVIVGLGGVCLIACALASSIRHNKRHLHGTE